MKEKQPTQNQYHAMRELEIRGYQINAVDGHIVLEKGDEIIKFSKEKHTYEAREKQRYITAEKIYKHFKNKKL